MVWALILKWSSGRVMCEVRVITLSGMRCG